MPLLKRVVWPPHVSRVPLVEDWVRDENGRVFPALLPATEQPQDLEAFTNLTLANLITQVSLFYLLVDTKLRITVVVILDDSTLRGFG